MSIEECKVVDPYRFKVWFVLEIILFVANKASWSSEICSDRLETLSLAQSRCREAFETFLMSVKTFGRGNRSPSCWPKQLHLHIYIYISTPEGVGVPELEPLVWGSLRLAPIIDDFIVLSITVVSISYVLTSSDRVCRGSPQPYHGADCV